jgi:hypothetical protein
MSQYFTYDDLQGRDNTDVLTADPSCKTCSTSKCYNTYDNVQGVSLSKYTPFSSIRLGENDRTPLAAFACDTYMLNCNTATIQNADPYNVTVKSTTKCEPLKYTNLDIEVPKMTGSLNRNKVESPRYVSHKSQRNSYNLATDVIIPKSIRDLSVEKVNLDVYNITPFDYTKTEVIVKPVKTSLSVQPKPLSYNAASNKNARDESRQLSSVSSVSSKTSVNSKLLVSPKIQVKATKTKSVLTKPLKKSTSSRSDSSRSTSSRSASSRTTSPRSTRSTASKPSTRSTASTASKPLVGSNIKSSRVPLTLPVSSKRK